LKLSGRQRVILSALNEHHDRLGVMYLGALHVLRSDNPDRLALCAHSVRELIEKLPDHVDLPAAAHSEPLKQPRKPPDLKPKVQELAQSWKTVAGEIQAATLVDAKLRKFHVRVAAFFGWFEQNYSTRREMAVKALRKLDASGRPLPQPVEDLRVRTWQTYNDFFQGVAHHGKSPTEEELASWLDAFEGFLVDSLRPRTFDDFATLDAIIQEGEQDAKP